MARLSTGKARIFCLSRKARELFRMLYKRAIKVLESFARFRNTVSIRVVPGLVSVVSDSYDIFRAVTEIWGEELREKVYCSFLELQPSVTYSNRK